MLDIEAIKANMKQIRAEEEAMKSKEGFICRVPGCGGDVIRRAYGLYRGIYDYGPPKCKRCGTLHSGDAPTGGEEEFWKAMRIPYTL